MRPPDIVEQKYFGDEGMSELGHPGAGISLTIEDNGICGDGLIVEIRTEGTSDKQSPLFWGSMTKSGAMALRDILDHILNLRKIDKESDMEDE